ncbi:hypothetical protein ACFSO7_12205 [Bacillus sp. CGMCC 1.16607]|uniref:hypothetical protein n=1 Tax=Bacillus sp. CGMCC 1.16607 TaxID=3351842 RepID=UPI0036315157
MRKLFFIFLILIFLIVGCKGKDKSPVLYFGEGKDWYGLFTYVDEKETSFETLFLQSNTGDNEKEIEFKLQGIKSSLESSSPQKINETGSYQTVVMIHDGIIVSDFPNELTLTVMYGGKREEITLKKQN